MLQEVQEPVLSVCRYLPLLLPQLQPVWLEASPSGHSDECRAEQARTKDARSINRNEQRVKIRWSSTYLVEGQVCGYFSGLTGGVFDKGTVLLVNHLHVPDFAKLVKVIPTQTSKTVVSISFEKESM